MEQEFQGFSFSSGPNCWRRAAADRRSGDCEKRIMAANTSTRRSPRCQFSLRTLMIAVSLVGILLGWRESLVRETRRLREALDQFATSGGEFKYQCTADEYGVISFRKSSDEPGDSQGIWPEWLAGDRRGLAPEIACYPVIYDVGGLGVPPMRKEAFSVGNDDGLRSLRSSPTLRMVSTGVSDGVTDIGLGYIATLPKLEALIMRRSRITDEGLRQLQGCSALKKLDLSGTGISDDGLASISSLANLRELFLADTKITDNGMKSLEAFQCVRKLILSRTQISDRALTHVGLMPNLEVLEIDGTTITDGGLNELRGLPHLKAISARLTRVSLAGAREFERMLPGVKVDVESVAPRRE